jgi:hypothetical protein
MKMRFYLFLCGLFALTNEMKAQSPPEFNVTYSRFEKTPEGLSGLELFSKDSAFYEDQEYIVLQTCNGEWGGSVVFKNKVTGLRYYCAADCPVMVSKLNGSYYITASLSHMGNTTSIIEIRNPKKLKPEIPTGKKRLVTDHDPSMIGSVILADTVGIYTLVSFTLEGELYHVISDDEKGYVAIVKNGKFEIVQKLTDYYLSNDKYIPRITADGHCQLYFESRTGFGYIDISGRAIRLYSSQSE